LRAQYDTSGEGGTSFVLTVEADDKPLFKILRQYDQADPALRKFAANDGFTGLMYVMHPQHTGDYQLSCGTRAARKPS
jgi:hypothetical protein